MALTKVFRIELTGGKDVEKDITSIKKAMTSMATAIAKAKGELAALLVTKGDPGEITKLTAKLSDLEAKMKSLSQQRKNAETDAKRQAEAEKILADVKLKEAQATKALEQAELARTQAQVAQEKELDRQIALEQKEQRELEKKKKALDALPNSYLKIKEALAQLKPFTQSGGAGGTINFQGKQINFDQAIGEYKRLSLEEQNFRRQFQADGTLVSEYAAGIVNAFKRLNIDDIIKNQVDGAKQQLGDLEKKTTDLVVAYRRAQQEGSQDLNKLEKEIHDNVTETQRLKKAVSEAEVQLKGIGGVGEQITGSINKGFKELKNNIGQFALTYVGFQAIFSGLQTGVDNAKQFSDQTTELEIQLNKAAGGADRLIDNLAGLNTRTKLTALEDIANIALKAGTTEQNLLGVTKAIDTVKTAFGKDFGDIETGTETFVKLINIFYEDGQVTEDRILKIGNSVRTLANETVASVPFINDFAGRMAGVRQVANVSLPQIIGLGAGFEEFKQSAEVSSTVLVKVIPQLARDIETFSDIAGVTREEFKKLLQENPIEALLKVSQGLVAGKGDVEVFANTLKEAGIDAGRTTSIIATLGGKADIFRDRIARAGTSINDTAAITDAFNRKNENLAATLDKIGKKFADVAAGKGFQITLLAISSTVTILIGNIPALLGLLGLLAIGWSVQNKELFILKARLLLVNAELLASRIGLGILTIAQAGYNAVLFITNGALQLATRALAFFGITVKATAGPLGIILTIATLLGAAFVAFGRRLEEARGNLSEFARLQRINLEISREANKATADQIATLDGWIAVVKSAATSADTKKRAMDKIIEINPAFRNALKGQTIDLNELDKAYGKVVQGIQAKARAEAAATLSAGKQRKVTEIAGLRQDLEIQVAQKSKANQVALDVELTEEQKAILKQGDFLGGAIIQFTDTGAQLFKQRFDQIKKYLDKKEKEAIGVYQDYLKAQALAEENLTKAEAQVQKTPGIDPTETVFKIFDRLIANNGTGSDFKDLLKKIQEQKKLTDVLSKEYKDLLALEAKVKDLLKPKGSGTGRGSRLSGDQKDKFKDIDAIRDRLLAEQSKLFIDLQIDEQTYLQNILRINTEAIDKKLNIIKGKNAEERKVIAELNLEKLKIQKDTNQKLFELDNKQIEINLRNANLAAQQQLSLTELNPNLSNEQRLQAKEDFLNAQLKAQIVFNQEQIALEKKYGVASIENEQKRKEAIEKINKELQDNQKQRPEAQIKDIQDAGDRQVREFNLYFSKLRQAILENNRITSKEKQRQLAELEKAERRTILSAELAALTLEVKKKKELQKQGLISNDEYLKALEAQQEKAKQLAEANGAKLELDEYVNSFEGFIEQMQRLFKTGDLFDKEIVKKTGISIGYVIAESWDLAKSALQGYLQERERQIEQEKQDQLDSLDREKERVKARATSSAEEESIERQFANRKRQIDKEAGEQLKKQKRSEAKISLAAELANIAVMAAANPANAATFGAAGAIQFAILSAFALGRYILRVNDINKTQFAFGGLLKKKQYGFGGKAGEVPVDGGKFGGRSHSQGGTDFAFNGNNYNAEVDELSVIRTKNAPRNRIYSITGNHTQIASALNSLGGGKSFSSGASINKLAMGGALGSRLKAPTFSASYYLNGGNVGGGQNNNSDIQELKQMVAEVTAAVYATDAKDVLLNPGKVTKAQRKTTKDTSVGTI